MSKFDKERRAENFVNLQFYNGDSTKGISSGSAPPANGVLPKLYSCRKPGHKRTESVLSRISKLSIKSLGRAGRQSDEEEDEDDPDTGPSHSGSRCYKSQPLLLAKLYKRYPKFPCVLCKLSLPSLPTGRFTKNFEWKSSTSYDRRLVSIGNKVPAEDLFGSIDGVDLTNMQTIYKGHRRNRENQVKTSKYRLLTFIPVNLYEQFRRLVNLYFLVSLILTFLLPYTPIDPTSWILSFLFIVVVTMLKQGYEDYLRHRLDK